MVEAVEPKTSDSAEKAYAAAAELAIAQADTAKPEPAAELQFPAKPKRAELAVATPVAEIRIPAELETAVVTTAKTPAKSAPAKKSAIPKPKTPSPAVVVKKVAVKKAVAKPAATAAPKFKTATPSKPKFKEPRMATKTTKDYTATIKAAAADVQAKAKLALAMGSEVLGEAGAFTKGNVEAVKSSGKILSAGLQGLGKTYVSEGKSAYATVTGDVKELKAVKSPTDLVRLQTSILRRKLDHAFDFGGKNSETMIKLAGEVFAPISARASLAIAKVKKAA